jgi:hypothetical protein
MDSLARKRASLEAIWGRDGGVYINDCPLRPSLTRMERGIRRLIRRLEADDASGTRAGRDAETVVRFLPAPGVDDIWRWGELRGGCE